MLWDFSALIIPNSFVVGDYLSLSLSLFGQKAKFRFRCNLVVMVSYH